MKEIYMSKKCNQIKTYEGGSTMKSLNLWVCSALLITAMGFSTITNAALVSRLGGLAYYDDVADLTWLADANAAGTTMNWDTANIWAAGLTVDGVGGWRLPNMDVNGDAVIDCYGGGEAGCLDNEYGYMYWQNGVSSSTPSPFSNVQSDDVYWSATEYAPDTNGAWVFNMYRGDQYDFGKAVNLYAWAVQSGDVSAVPVPAAVWLFGSGLVGLIGLARRKR